MTERAIVAGDLVQVVRGMPCCGHPTPMQGHIFQVTYIYTGNPMGATCDYCDRGFKSGELLAKGGDKPIDVVRLKRIPPLDELEGTHEWEPTKFTEPA